MKDLEYITVIRVLDTWDAARRISGSDQVLGNRVVERFLVLEPRVLHDYPSNPHLVDFKGNNKHGDRIVGLLDSLLQLLGPDLELFAEICTQVGHQHARMEIPKAYFPKLGLALVQALQETFDHQYDNNNSNTTTTSLSEDDLDAWREVYKTMSDEILRAMD